MKSPRTVQIMRYLATTQGTSACAIAIALYGHERAQYCKKRVGAVHATITRLRMEGLAEDVGPGVFRLTADGQDVLAHMTNSPRQSRKTTVSTK